MSAPEPRATAEDVSNELDGALDPSEIDEKWLQRARHMVDKRAPDVDGWLAEQLESLLAAHIAYTYVTGAATGARKERIQSQTATVQYDVPDGPEGETSPYWARAVKLHPPIADDTSDFFVETL